MDAKITLSFNEAVAVKAKQYAEKNNVSLSRLVEFLLDKVTSSGYTSFEEFPVSDWVKPGCRRRRNLSNQSTFKKIIKE